MIPTNPYWESEHLFPAGDDMAYDDDDYEDFSPHAGSPVLVAESIRPLVGRDGMFETRGEAAGWAACALLEEE